MEGVARRQHARPAVVEAGQLECILIGLGAAVDEEELVVVVAADLTQSLGQLLLQAVDDAVGIEAKLIELLRNALCIVGMAVADADDGVATVEVEILLPLVVPDVGTTAADNVDVE